MTQMTNCKLVIDNDMQLMFDDGAYFPNSNVHDARLVSAKIYTTLFGSSNSLSNLVSYCAHLKFAYKNNH